jgi:hypothetical protein
MGTTGVSLVPLARANGAPPASVTPHAPAIRARFIRVAIAPRCVGTTTTRDVARAAGTCRECLQVRCSVEPYLLAATAVGSVLPIDAPKRLLLARLLSTAGFRASAEFSRRALLLFKPPPSGQNPGRKLVNLFLLGASPEPFERPARQRNGPNGGVWRRNEMARWGRFGPS